VASLNGLGGRIPAVWVAALTGIRSYYLKRPEMGTMQSAYFSDQCAPGKELDEHLSDSTWVTLETSEDDAFTMSLPAP
jgi:hypothetical protein